MLEAFLLSFRLRIAYRVNGILYGLRRLPLLRKLLPSRLYDVPPLKAFAQVLSVLSELFGFFFGKILYLAAFILLAVSIFRPMHSIGSGALFLHIFFFLTLTGTILYNTLYESDANSYYAVFLMRMDARRYALSKYAYYLFKTFVGFAGTLAMLYLFARSFAKVSDARPIWIILMPLFVVCAKLTVSAANIMLFRKKGKLLISNRFTKIMVTLSVITLAGAYVPPFFGVVLTSAVFYAACAVFAAASVPAALYLFRSTEYRRIYQYHPYSPVSTADLQHTVQDAYRQKLVFEKENASSKSGCALFNELFVRRHRKLLTRPALRIALILAALLAAAVVLFLINRDIASSANEIIMKALPILLLVMYFINRGPTISQIFFFSCDHSMLTYRFYRQPKVILELFRARLGTIIAINLIPSSVIAFGLPLLLFISGGTERPLDYLVLFLSTLSMSVFFSVHYLVLYYLLQPYTAGLEAKNPAYMLLTGLTYTVCYLFGTRLGRLMSPLSFGCVLIGFCLLYIPIALVLAYKLAPKTFKLR